MPNPPFEKSRLHVVAEILRGLEARWATPEPPRVLVVGEVNPYGADPKFALYPRPRHASGNRLREIMGLTDACYMRLLARVNLCAGKWEPRQARLSALDVLEAGNHPVLVLLGAKVRAAFEGPPAFQVVQGLDAKLVGLPHPSGLCRAWNEPGAVERARAALAEAAPWVPWGMTDMKAELLALTRGAEDHE
jgi:hypothetical protein